MFFVGDEIVERIVADTSIFNELLAKLAQAHSIRDYGTVYQECTRHQLEFIRRDMERILKHSDRTMGNTAKLFETWRSNGASSPLEEVGKRA